MASYFRNFFGKISRRRIPTATSIAGPQEIQPEHLNRCITTCQLLFLGVGSILGQGVYVVAGEVAYSEAGPATVLSFIIAGVAALMSGLCYAELSTNSPLSGSGYSYVYVTVGELPAFIVGWNMLLEYVVGSASCVRAASAYFDALLNGVIVTFEEKYLSLDLGSYFSSYVDLVGLFLAGVIVVLLILGVADSIEINKFLTILNIVIVVLFVSCTFPYIKLIFWSSSYSDSTSYSSGFFPYGVSGMLTGAATCFYGYASFECICASGEEAKSPERSIPVALIGAILICCSCYVAITAMMTLVLPYYELSGSTAILSAIAIGLHDWVWLAYTVAVSAIIALVCSGFGCSFPIPRIAYAMSVDRILPKPFSYLNKCQIPFVSALTFGGLTCLFVIFFTLSDLVKMMSIGTLIAYSMVCVSVLVIRYRPDATDHNVDLRTNDVGYTFLFKLLNPALWKDPTFKLPCKASWEVARISFSFCILSGWASAVSCYYLFKYDEAVVILSVLSVVFLLLAVCALFITVLLPQQSAKENNRSFRTPLVPLLPIVTCILNLFLMVLLNSATWIRFAGWCLIGSVIYFGYGIRHSTAETV